MMKSLLTGMALCTALAIFAGNADAHVRKAVRKAHVHRVPVYAKQITPSTLSSLTAKGGPLHDCVHVFFPQCSRGYGEPND